MSLPSVLFQSSSASKQETHSGASPGATAMLNKVAASPLSRERSSRVESPESFRRAEVSSDARSMASTPIVENPTKSHPQSVFENGYFSFPDFDRLRTNQTGNLRKEEKER
ncbi:MAG: hypothetical protein M1837_000298 [Sclerophora amabilis]|nr:MAG: hypothetical protein M1837_000298 [Sclerophora amabilis]